MSFDHLAPGTAEQHWNDDARFAQAPPLVLPGLGASVLVLAAHPDDETLGAGGLLASLALAGASITVVIATDGDASHPNSPTHSREQLARIRRAEVTAAVAELAPAAMLHFLGLPDGRVEDYEAQLLDQLEAVAPTSSTVVAPWSHDRHPDHEACGRAAKTLATRRGATLLEYPIWVWHWALPAEDPSLAWAPDGPPVRRLRRLDLSAAVQAVKQRALAGHISQTHPLSDRPGDEAILPEGILAHFQRSFELFVSTPAAANGEYFDRLYADADDPWDLEHRFYEQRKRQLLLAALPRPRFRRAFEPGCATGLLTQELARRCDEVVALDVVDRAVTTARSRVSQPGIDIRSGHIPADWPTGSFDLIVISEVGYYCPDLSELRARIESSLTADGTLVACHWRHPAADHPHSAEAVHDALGAGLANIVSHLEADFRLDVWNRTGASVAHETGII